MNTHDVMNTRERTLAPGSDSHLTALWTTAGMVETDRPLPDIVGLEAAHQAVIGDPAPMALFGFAVGTFLVAIVLTGIWPVGSTMGVIPALLWFAGVGQFIGGLFALTRGSTFGATAFCSFGMGNIIVATYTWMQQAGVIPVNGSTHAMLGVGLFCFGYIALTLAVAALRTNLAYLLTVGALVPGYVLSGIPDVGGPAGAGHVGGWFLVAAAVFAFYSGGAVVANSQWCREVFPLGKVS